MLHKDAKLASWEVRALTAASRLMFLKQNLEYKRSGTRMQSGLLFKIERPKSKSFINSIAYKLRSSWNELPPNLRNIGDQLHFNLAVKRFYVTRYFENN